MSPIRIPEGHQFVPRAPGVALELLEAADRIKADRKTEVRTVSGGYHVSDRVAAEYQKNQPEVEETEDETEGAPTGQDQGQQASAAQAGVLVDDANGAGGQGSSDDSGSGDGSGDDSTSSGDEGEQPTAEWTHERINAYAATLTPPLELTGSTPSKAEKLQLIADHKKDQA